MRALRRLAPLLLILAATFFVVHQYGWPWEWVYPWAGDGVAAGDRRPEKPVSITALRGYTRRVVGTVSFRRDFVRMVFKEKGDSHAPPGPLTKWTRARVAVDVLNDGGPGMERYVETLVRQIDRIEPVTRFVVVVDGSAQITIRFVSHKDFRDLHAGRDVVGNCATQYSNSDAGLIYAHITVDAGVLKTPAQRRATVIHELTHALGFNGHFRDAAYQRQSVLYYMGTITSWSQRDAAAIRVMYSSGIRHGMSVREVEQALRQMGSAKR